MRKTILLLATALSLSGCVEDYDHPHRGYGPPPGGPHGPGGYEEGYDAGRHYREDPRYGERRLSREDRVYRGRDGRYYCRRSDGTTGLIVGAIAGGVLGNIIAPGGSEALGTILGAGIGGVAGHAIDQGDVRCRLKHKLRGAGISRPATRRSRPLGG
jgi:hypothetical protein